MSTIHCIKYQNFTQFPDVDIFWKFTGSAKFWANRKLYGNCAFPQNFYKMKLGEIFAILRSDIHGVTPDEHRR